MLKNNVWMQEEKTKMDAHQCVLPVDSELPLTAINQYSRHKQCSSFTKHIHSTMSYERNLTHMTSTQKVTND